MAGALTAAIASIFSGSAGAPPSVEYLVVAGGGGGASRYYRLSFE